MDKARKQASALLERSSERVRNGVVATFRKNRVTLGGLLLRFLTSATLIGLTYAGLYLSIGKPFHFGGPAWSTMLIWAAAQGAGWIFGVMRLPALLGMLMVGLILQNACPSAVQGLPSSWSSFLRTVALATIFLRSGLELDIKVFRRVGPAAVRLLLIPGLTEAAIDGALAQPILGLPVLWGFTLGFILKAVGPAIVITTMHEVQKQRLGVAKGIPSIIVAAASFDDMVAITGYGLFSNFAFAHTNENLGWSIAHGPVEIVVGTVAGCLAGLFSSCTFFWRTRLQRTVVAFMSSITLIFMFYSYNMRSAGPLACLVTGMSLRVLLDKGWPGFLSTGANPEHAQKIERDMGVLWRWACQPLLFGIIGTLVNLRKTEPGIIPRALGLILSGLVVRIPMSFLAVSGAGLTVLERVFVAVAWTPKATVQAALGPLPLDTILSHEGPESPNIAYAEAVLTTSVLAILVCGTFGVLAIHILAPRCLAVGSDPSPGTAERKLWLAQLAQGALQSEAEAGRSAGADMRVELEASVRPPPILVAAGGTQHSAGQLSDEQWLRHASGRDDTQDDSGRDDDSNESYESWRHALHAALSHTRYSLASFITTAASILPAARPRQHRAPSHTSPQRLSRQGLELHDRAMSLGVPPRQAVVPVSPSAPVLMPHQAGFWSDMAMDGGTPAATGRNAAPDQPEPGTATALGVLESIQSAPADFDMSSPEDDPK